MGSAAEVPAKRHCSGALRVHLALFRPLAGVKGTPLAGEKGSKNNGKAPLTKAALYHRRPSVRVA